MDTTFCLFLNISEIVCTLLGWLLQENRKRGEVVYFQFFFFEFRLVLTHDPKGRGKGKGSWALELDNKTKIREEYENEKAYLKVSEDKPFPKLNMSAGVIVFREREPA